MIEKFCNFLMGRVKVEIETPQFLSNGDNFYMLKQTGYLYYLTLKFKPEKNNSPNHSVQFHSINDVYNSIINWF